ncbi:MAG TPA: glycosyltransferase [Steroidobacteraceae bacterium]|nr:glycosyltransferase [Steroidobacteraceae bacterium]
MSDGSKAGAVVFPSTRYATLTLGQRALVVTFLAVGISYLSWRPGTFNPDAPLFSALVFGAEVFGFLCALLYLLMCWRLRQRTPLPVPEGATVAVFVPTINESIDIVRRTVMAAQRMKQATEVWLLDDGNRLEMQVLAEELGCRYLSRTENSHAKAGNLNNALGHIDAEFVAIFDADHAPAPNFLEETLGFFRDPKVAFVQTPQDFYNLDSFQHRLNRRESLVWSEQTLFFRVIQPGKDSQDAAFFCGSCAVIRRKALDDIGGFSTGTVTEDIHTSIRLHKRGWKSVYYARSLAFGLAPASAIPFLKQRLRWGQGAMQVWRQEGVLFSRGLGLRQRLSYLATMLAYFEGWQRLIFFTAPVIVLTTGTMPILQLDREFLVRFLPYYVLTFWTFEEVARGYGRTLLTEQYNMMRFAVFITATFGFFLRRLRFVVTPKQLGEANATRRMLWPQYLVLVFNLIAIPVGIALMGTDRGLPTGALVANVLWAALTCGIAAIAIRYALQAATSRRREYRFPLPVPLRVFTPNGQDSVALATDISPLGCRVVGAAAGTATVGQELTGELLLPTGPLAVRVMVRAVSTPGGDTAGAVEPALGCEFRWGLSDERNRLEMFLFGSDLQWKLNGLSDRVPTPLERARSWLRTGPVEQTRRLAGETWAPVLYKRVNSEEGSGVGFISRSDPKTGVRTMVSLGVLPQNGRLYAEEVTASGPRGVVGRVQDEAVLETHAAPIYLYKLTA